MGLESATSVACGRMLAQLCRALGSGPLLQNTQGTGGPSSFLSPRFPGGDLLHNNSSVLKQ